MSAPGLSVVILSWNTLELTRACLRTLAAETPARSREIIVVDNGSEDGSPDMVADEFPDVRLLRNAENRGYSGGNNQGARAAVGKYLCLLNSDTEIEPGALDALVDFLERNPTYGAVAPKLINPDGSVQRACMSFPGPCTAFCFDTVWGRFPPGSWVEDHYFMRSFDHLTSRDVDQPPSACFVIDRAEYLERGGLDEELWLFFNDVDLCRRLNARGRRIRYFAEAVVTHHGGASTRGFAKFVVVWHRNRLAYYRKHFGRWIVPYMRFIVRMRALEEWVRAGFRQKDQGARRAERAYLRQTMREILAGEPGR